MVRAFSVLAAALAAGLSTSAAAAPVKLGVIDSLTGPEALTLDEVAAALSTVLGRRIAYRNPGVFAFLRHVRAAGRPLALGLVMTGVYTAARLGLAAGVEPDLERLIGRAATPFRRFAADYAIDWRPGSLPSPPA